MVEYPADWRHFVPTLVVTTRVVQPTAGQTIADLGQLAGGIYHILVMASYGATPDAIDNMSLHLADRKVCDLPVIPLANSLPIPVDLPALIVMSGQGLSVQANAAGAVGSVYRATIIATPVKSQNIT